jgi:hypothetical protein
MFYEVINRLIEIYKSKGEQVVPLLALLSSFKTVFSKLKKQKIVFAEIWLLRLLYVIFILVK